MAVLLSAAWDGEMIVMESGHAYLRCRWLRTYLPGTELWDMVERRTRGHFSAANN
jgi:hypothetical protein